MFPSGGQIKPLRPKCAEEPHLSLPDVRHKIVKNKKALQAHVDGAELGNTPSQQFIYNAFLWRTPLIITTNNFDLSSLQIADREWVESNSISIHISEPVWAERHVQLPGVISAGKRVAAARTPLSTPPRKLGCHACPKCHQYPDCLCVV